MGNLRKPSFEALHCIALQVPDQEDAGEGRGGADGVRLEVRGDGDRQVLPDRAEHLHRDDHRGHVHLRAAPHRQVREQTQVINDITTLHQSMCHFHTSVL